MNYLPSAKYQDLWSLLILAYLLVQDLSAREADPCTVPMTCLQENADNASTFLQCDQKYVCPLCEFLLRSFLLFENCMLLLGNGKAGMRAHITPYTVITVIN